MRSDRPSPRPASTRSPRPGTASCSRIVAANLETTLGRALLARRAVALGWPKPENHHRWFGETICWLTRAVRPGAIVETGVEKGLTSYCWLRGLADNGAGTPYSIELPTVGATPRRNADGRLDGSHVESESRTGALVPPSLRHHRELTLGDAKGARPSLLSRWGTIDIFFHDSDHSYDHQLWTYRTA